MSGVHHRPMLSPAKIITFRASFQDRSWTWKRVWWWLTLALHLFQCSVTEIVWYLIVVTIESIDFHAVTSTFVKDSLKSDNFAKRFVPNRYQNASTQRWINRYPIYLERNMIIYWWSIWSSIDDLFDHLLMIYLIIYGWFIWSSTDDPFDLLTGFAPNFPSIDRGTTTTHRWFVVTEHQLAEMLVDPRYHCQTLWSIDLNAIVYAIISI